MAIRRFASASSVNSAIRNVCDIMRRSSCSGAMQYVPELTWILFLCMLDEREIREVQESKGAFSPSIEAPYRWQDWADPKGQKRREILAQGQGALLAFVNEDLIPHLRQIGNGNASPRRRIISQVMSSIARVHLDTEQNLIEILDEVSEICATDTDPQHVFMLSQVYESLLLKMGEKNNDGGQFFTPREVVRAMVQTIDPKIGETVYDPCCGTGGFLVQSFEYIWRKIKHNASGEKMETLKQRMFFGREKENLMYPIALANLVLHGIDQPNVWHGNTLTGQETYGDLYQDAPAQFDVILTNPPFGGKESKDAQALFPFPSSSTQVLFLQHVISSLKPGGRCGIILDDGVLYRQREHAVLQLKKKLLDECDLQCIVSLPKGTFINAGASVKANILFFTKGIPTEQIWYYDLSHVWVNKRNPLTLDRFEEYFSLLPTKTDSDHSWIISRQDIEEKNYDLRAVNPHTKPTGNTRSTEELLDFIEAKGLEVAEALAALRKG